MVSLCWCDFCECYEYEFDGVIMFWSFLLVNVFVCYEFNGFFLEKSCHLLRKEDMQEDMVFTLILIRIHLGSSHEAPSNPCRHLHPTKAAPALDCHWHMHATKVICHTSSVDPGYAFCSKNHTQFKTSMLLALVVQPAVVRSQHQNEKQRLSHESHRLLVGTSCYQEACHFHMPTLAGHPQWWLAMITHLHWKTQWLWDKWATETRPLWHSIILVG